MKKLKQVVQFAGAIMLVLANMMIVAAGPASAASLKVSSIRDSRMAVGATGGLRLIFQAVTTGVPASFTVNLNGSDATTWTGSTGVVNTTQNTDTSTCGATALPGTLTASGSGSTITITGVTSLTAGTNYCVDLLGTGVIGTPSGWNSVTNPSTAGEYHPVITSGSDSITVALRVVTSDQIVVNAVVPPTFNMTITNCSSGQTDNFTANLSTTASTSTHGCDITINTNAKNGWTAWAKDANTGLASIAAGKTIASTTPGTNGTLSGGTEGYVMGVTAITQGSGAGTTSATNAYGNNLGGLAAAGQGSGLDASLRSFASSTGTANGAVVTIKESATTSAITPAANDYTDTITVISAGSF